MKFKFFPDHDVVLSHIKKTNPHAPGSARDALTHGISNVEDYLWTKEIEISVESFNNSNIEIGLSLRNLKKYQNKIKENSFPPAVVALMKNDGKIYLVDGGHRVTAIKKEGFETVNAFIGILPEDLELLVSQGIFD